MLNDSMTNEVDYNHPDYPGKQNIVELATDTEAIYIHVPTNMPPNKARQYARMVEERFKELLPHITVIAGPDDLKFTTISKKQVFKGKLDGTIAP